MSADVEVKAEDRCCLMDDKREAAMVGVVVVEVCSVCPLGKEVESRRVRAAADMGWESPKERVGLVGQQREALRATANEPD